MQVGGTMPLAALVLGSMRLVEMRVLVCGAMPLMKLEAQVLGGMAQLEDQAQAAQMSRAGLALPA